MPPSYHLDQEVTVIQGEYEGRKGKIHSLRNETDRYFRVQLIDANGEHFYVNSTQLDPHLHSGDIILFVSDDERPHVLKRLDDLARWGRGEEGYESI